MGRFELARTAAVAGNQITLDQPMQAAFAAGFTQVLYVPEFNSVVVQSGATIEATPWDPVSKTGGIVAFLSRSDVLIDGVVSASGAGLRAGAYVRRRTDASSRLCRRERGGDRSARSAVKALPAARTAAPVTPTSAMPRAAACARARAAAVAVKQVAAGRAVAAIRSTTAARDIGGQPGAALTHASLLSRLLLGAGGGAGHGSAGGGSAGGAGGGVLFVRAPALLGSGSLSSAGRGGGQCVIRWRGRRRCRRQRAVASEHESRAASCRRAAVPAAARTRRSAPAAAAAAGACWCKAAKSAARWTSAAARPVSAAAR